MKKQKGDPDWGMTKEVGVFPCIPKAEMAQAAREEWD